MEREKLEKESKIDDLTGIYNSSAIKRLIQDALIDSDKEYAFGILDLDYFKHVNDEFGHFIGDQVLTHAALAMQEAFGEQCILGRLGGDEFAVFMPHNVKYEEVEKCCQIMQEKMSVPMKNFPPITVSMGFVIGHKEKDFNNLYQQTDKVLYDVKDTGRNAYKIIYLDS